jgi:kynureninase
MGHAAPFDFTDDYVPCSRHRAVPRRNAAGPQPRRAGGGRGELRWAWTWSVLWGKSVSLFELFDRLVEERCGGFGLQCISPREPERRGSHISYHHPNAFEICQALIAAGVIGDFRSPDVVRFGLTPLYLGFEDVWQAVERLRTVLETESWRDARFAVRSKVT